MNQKDRIALEEFESKNICWKGGKGSLKEEKLMEQCRETSITGLVIAQRKRWLGHALKMKDVKKIRRVLKKQIVEIIY